VTCCIAAQYDDGILIGTDTRISAGDTTMTLGEAKTFDWNGIRVAYAGCLHYVQQLQRQPCLGYDDTPEGFQQLVWDFPPAKGEKGDTEFLVVTGGDIHAVSGWGDMVRVIEPYAVIGSEGKGAVGMALEYPRVRIRTLAATKRMLAKVLRVVALHDNTVAEPFCYEEL
jgi:ATP-dependent protease HslVU (ClpYQ) peptidase subunit